MDSRINVAVGVIYNNEKDKVLIARRKQGQHLAGYWEFPGGKISFDEDIKSALKRELSEELGINVLQSEPLTVIQHDYSDKKVLLHVRIVNDWNGSPAGKENQDIVWASIKELDKYTFPEANKNIIRFVSLPSVYLISQDIYKDHSNFIAILQKCFKGGLKLFQLRLASRTDIEFEHLVREIKQLADKYDTKFILNGSPADIDVYDIDGIHLKSNEMLKYSKRPIDNRFLLGASCHSKQELKHAITIDVDYVFISPVNKTISHPSQPALGWKGFQQFCHLTSIPVYALGGMQPSDVKNAKLSGGHGIAMISAIWNSDSPDATIQLIKT